MEHGPNQTVNLNTLCAEILGDLHKGSRKKLITRRKSELYKVATQSLYEAGYTNDDLGAEMDKLDRLIERYLQTGAKPVPSQSARATTAGPIETQESKRFSLFDFLFWSVFFGIICFVGIRVIEARNTYKYDGTFAALKDDHVQFISHQRSCSKRNNQDRSWIKFSDGEHITCGALAEIKSNTQLNLEAQERAQVEEKRLQQVAVDQRRDEIMSKISEFEFQFQFNDCGHRPTFTMNASTNKLAQDNAHLRSWRSCMARTSDLDRDDIKSLVLSINGKWSTTDRGFSQSAPDNCEGCQEALNDIVKVFNERRAQIKTVRAEVNDAVKAYNVSVDAENDRKRNAQLNSYEAELDKARQDLEDFRNRPIQKDTGFTDMTRALAEHSDQVLGDNDGRAELERAAQSEYLKLQVEYYENKVIQSTPKNIYRENQGQSTYTPRKHSKVEYPPLGEFKPTKCTGGYKEFNSCLQKELEIDRQYKIANPPKERPKSKSAKGMQK